MRLFLVAAALFIAFPAAAQLYVCNDGGKISFSSQQSGEHCRLQKSFERTNQPAQSAQPAHNTRSSKLPSAPQAAGKNSSNSTPHRYPVVSTTTQKIRDKKRLTILQHELKQEQARHQITRRQIQESQNTPESEEKTYLLAHLAEQLHIYQQNITAIKQEIARL